MIGIGQQESVFLARALRQVRCRTVVGIVLTVVLALELSLRIWFDERLRLGGYPRIYVEDATFGYLHVPGREDKICIPGICRPVSINAGGLLGPHHQKEKGPGVYRVALVGDCDSTGIWSDLGRSHAEYLESMLRSDGFEVEIYNFSRDGIYLEYERQQAARKLVPDYSPDLVLLQVDQLPFLRTNQRRAVYRDYILSWGADVPNARDDAERKVDYIEDHTALIQAYEMSFIARAIVERYVNMSAEWPAEYLRAFTRRRVIGESRPMPLSMRESLGIVLDTQRALEARGIEMLVFGRLNRGLAARKGVRVVGVEVPAGAGNYNHFDAGHLSDRGQRELARQLYDVIKPRVAVSASARR
jgi:hypothetical protein